jgi:predicted double-glycine peptidase
MTVGILTIWLAILAMASQSSLLWLDVPFVRQEKNACGAASISMVMQYWAQQQGKPAGTAADAVAIQRQLYSEKVHGILASDLQRYIDEHGFRSYVFHGGWDDLQQHITKGRPLIVAIGESGRHGPLHYVVVAGVDPDRRLVMINDPANRKLMKVDWKDFDRDWALTDHWTLLAIPR